MGTNSVKIIHIKVVHLRETYQIIQIISFSKENMNKNTNIQSQQLEWTKKATKIIAWEYSASALEILDKMYLFLGKYHPAKEF